MQLGGKPIDAFLSHSHGNAVWVENLARKLEDDCGFKIWLDRWTLIPGKSWQQAMGRGLDDAASCAVCVGNDTPQGWFREEIERALDMQTRNHEFRVIPVLLPNSDPSHLSSFLSLRTWADFRDGQDLDFALHVLKQGIKGVPIGRWPPIENDRSIEEVSKHEKKLAELKRLRQIGALHDEVVIEYERKILDRWLGDDM